MALRAMIDHMTAAPSRRTGVSLPSVQLPQTSSAVILTIHGMSSCTTSRPGRPRASRLIPLAIRAMVAPSAPPSRRTAPSSPSIQMPQTSSWAIRMAPATSSCTRQGRPRSSRSVSVALRGIVIPPTLPSLRMGAWSPSTQLPQTSSTAIPIMLATSLCMTSRDRPGASRSVLVALRGIVTPTTLPSLQMGVSSPSTRLPQISSTAIRIHADPSPHLGVARTSSCATCRWDRPRASRSPPMALRPMVVPTSLLSRRTGTSSHSNQAPQTWSPTLLVSSLTRFVHDRQTGQTERVSVDSHGNQGNSVSYDPSISADGRFVAFYSLASNLVDGVDGDTNNTYDVFVHDRQTGQTTRVSVDSNDAQANGGSFNVSLSADGRAVAFYSNATNLVSGDTNGTDDFFVADRGIAQSFAISVTSVNDQPTLSSFADQTVLSGSSITIPFQVGDEE